MRLSTILSLALGVIAPLTEAAALAPLTNATVEATTNGTISALARRAGYRNWGYADCQNGGPGRFIDEDICYVMAESTHAIRLNEIPPNCAGKSQLPTPCERVVQFTGAICSLWVCFSRLHGPYMVQHADYRPVYAYLV